MKYNYLALISRTEFNTLFKFGRILLNSDLTSGCSMSNKLENLDKDNDFINKISKIDFDDTFSNLIIQYQKNTSVPGQKLNEIKIQDVKHIYPLNNDAKREFEISFDERIKIENPIFDVNEIFMQKAFDDCKRGIENVWQIFDLSDKQKEKCQKIITDDIIKQTVQQMLSGEKIEGDYPLWVYLMRYERHSYYPKETLGYFMDVVHIFCNYAKRGQTDDKDVENTDIFKMLTTINISEKSEIIHQSIEKTAFCIKLNELEKKCNFLKVAVIYLTIRDKYIEGLKYDSKFVNLCKEHFEENFVIASYLLGIFLGYDKTYDCLYDKIKLSIFKSAEEMSQLQIQKEKSRRIAEEKMRDPEQPNLFGSTTQQKGRQRKSKSTKKDGK